MMARSAAALVTMSVSVQTRQQTRQLRKPRRSFCRILCRTIRLALDQPRPHCLRMLTQTWAITALGLCLNLAVCAGSTVSVANDVIKRTVHSVQRTAYSAQRTQLAGVVRMATLRGRVPRREFAVQFRCERSRMFVAHATRQIPGKRVEKFGVLTHPAIAAFSSPRLSSSGALFSAFPRTHFSRNESDTASIR
jgi:hypothetical protein